MTQDAIVHEGGMSRRVAVIGGGAWGSALASALAQNGHDVRILTRRDDLATALEHGTSPALDGLAITAPSRASTDPAVVLDAVDAVVMVVPVSATASSLAQLRPYLPEGAPVAFAAKGLEPQDNTLICDYAAGAITNPVVMLSGPSFADEVAMGKPAGLVSASRHDHAARLIAGLFTGSNIRVYTSDDPSGVAVGGAVKNVIAIASGITAGLKLGDNARAALLTRGLAEAARLALALGGRQETLFGLAGLGDMTLTCSGPHSRNFAYGLALGEGRVPDGKLAEGRHSCAVIARRAALAGVEMPITEAVARVVAGDGDIMEEITQLMARPADSEWAN
ncbi:MAG: NAD(P)H-dependent glycerol-3-phosphate dehydrogenase [Alphaproteobacteria bacterium]|nr:NAD(P)H-dependent glycerol-3-phosphate dehydrogenase [Alphaproteobacteria bacterium]